MAKQSEPTAGRPIVPAGYGIATGSEGTLPWSHAAKRLAASRNYWVATTRADGRPHVMPVWGLWMDGAFYFSTDAASTKGRNLARSSEVVVHLESGDDVVVIEGAARETYDKDVLARFADEYDKKYQFRPEVDTPEPGVWELRPRVALAWREQDFPTSATRWVLDER